MSHNQEDSRFRLRVEEKENERRAKTNVEKCSNDQNLFYFIAPWYVGSRVQFRNGLTWGRAVPSRWVISLFNVDATAHYLLLWDPLTVGLGLAPGRGEIGNWMYKHGAQTHSVPPHKVKRENVWTINMLFWISLMDKWSFCDEIEFLHVWACQFDF